MNLTLKNAAKDILIKLLNQCTDAQQMMFKRMYCHNNLDATVEESVNLIDDEKIDWAISQCERTVANNSSASK